MQELQFCVQDFNLSWSPILNPLLWPIMTGSGESGWDHMAAKLAFLTLLLLHRLVSAQSSSFLYCEVDLFWCFMDGTILQQFIVFYASYIVHIILKLN